jgi:hypothetical protein
MDSRTNLTPPTRHTKSTTVRLVLVRTIVRTVGKVSTLRTTLYSSFRGRKDTCRNYLGSPKLGVPSRGVRTVLTFSMIRSIIRKVRSTAYFPDFQQASPGARICRCTQADPLSDYGPNTVTCPLSGTNLNATWASSDARGST